jgi:3-deoxy-D-manno-octulosonic-acid transferase
MHLILRFAYIVISYLLTPLILLHLFYKGFGNRDYWKRNGERFGFFKAQVPGAAIWVHAVSVGEVQAAAPLVRALLKEYPNRPLVLTTTTPTGSDRVRALFGDQVIHCYAPFDLAWPVKRFFNWCRPAIAIILETELWPNLYHECGRRKVPLVLASARVSPKSIERYKKLVSLFKETLSHGIVIAAQTPADAERFLLLGANPQRTHVTGNIKFDFDLPADAVSKGARLRQVCGSNRPVWVAASTHANEEEIVLRAHRMVQQKYPDALLMLVPRHPERFDGIASMLDKQGMRFVRHSRGTQCAPDTEVLLGDTMGDLMMFFAASDVAFVGGSLVAVGGHNLLEPAALRLPILTGPHNYNAQDIADMFIDSGAAVVVGNEAELADSIVRLFSDPAEREMLGDKAEAIIGASRGALNRLLALLVPLLR